MHIVSAATLRSMKAGFKNYLEEIFGLKDMSGFDDKFKGVMNLLADIRKDAKSKKDYVTSDKIRNQVSSLGINMNDEKDGSISWSGA